MPRILTVLRAVLLALAAITTVGCGLKGDLYLPDQTPPPPETPEGDGEREEDKRADGG